MGIDYRKPRNPPAAAPRVPGKPLAGTPAGRDLAYWVGAYRKLTAEIEAATVTNRDPWRKGQVNTRELYSRRAAAAARMAGAAEAVLREG